MGDVSCKGTIIKSTSCFFDKLDQHVIIHHFRCYWPQCPSFTDFFLWLKFNCLVVHVVGVWRDYQNVLHFWEDLHFWAIRNYLPNDNDSLYVKIKFCFKSSCLSSCCSAGRIWSNRSHNLVSFLKLEVLDCSQHFRDLFSKVDIICCFRNWVTLFFQLIFYLGWNNSSNKCKHTQQCFCFRCSLRHEVVYFRSSQHGYVGDNLIGSLCGWFCKRKRRYQQLQPFCIGFKLVCCAMYNLFRENTSHWRRTQLFLPCFFSLLEQFRMTISQPSSPLLVRNWHHPFCLYWDWNSIILDFVFEEDHFLSTLAGTFFVFFFNHLFLRWCCSRFLDVHWFNFTFFHSHHLLSCLLWHLDEWQSSSCQDSGDDISDIFPRDHDTKSCQRAFIEELFVSILTFRYFFEQSIELFCCTGQKVWNWRSVLRKMDKRIPAAWMTTSEWFYRHCCEMFPWST